MVVIGCLCFFVVLPDAASSKHKPAYGPPACALILILRKCGQDPQSFCSEHKRTEKLCSKHGLLLGQRHETPAARLVMGMIQTSPFRFLRARRELNEGECVEGGLARALEVEAGSGR